MKIGKLDREMKEQMAIRMLAEGKITISKAAEISGIDIWSFLDELKHRRIAWVKDSVIDKDLAEFRD
ncbi:MAG: UPF0175 family protein [Candidatus Aenigmarchaeota archaeon]|nr:UPF0175 family protein [Candidatus Aenigmarchaeota archaeon]